MSDWIEADDTFSPKPGMLVHTSENEVLLLGDEAACGCNGLVETGGCGCCADRVRVIRYRILITDEQLAEAYLSAEEARR